jgi:hypothetical protein
MKKIIIFLLAAILTACTVVVKPPADNERSIQRANDAQRDLDANTK